MTDKTLARLARFTIWMVVWAFVTLVVGATGVNIGWGWLESLAKHVFGVATGVLMGRYILWWEKF